MLLHYLGKQETQKLSFHLNDACFLTKKTQNTKHHLVRAEPFFTVKTINWVQQTGPMKGA